MIFVSSWDDGHPLDIRLAEMLGARELKATFYVPLTNSECHPVMGRSAVRSLDAAGFEIGSHTADHRYLDALPPDQARHQVLAGRQGLEEMLGHRVAGFCYPGGKRLAGIERWLGEAGILHARTVENLRTDTEFAPHAIPTTLQFYPHAWTVLLRNGLRAPVRLRRKIELVLRCRRDGPALGWMIPLIESMADEDVVFHLWGHSWEIERIGAWSALAQVLDATRDCARASLTVSELCERRATLANR